MRSAWVVFLPFVPLMIGCSTAPAKNLSKPATASGVVVPVTENDIKILDRASQILSDEQKWDRRDDRECPKDAVKFSLYCAMYQASLDVNGIFDHRLAALEEVRRTVEDASKGKNYEHRLMGYNNDISTQFEDIKRVLSTTQRRLEKRLRS